MASVVHRAYPASLVLLGKKNSFFLIVFGAFLYFELSSLIVLFAVLEVLVAGSVLGIRSGSARSVFFGPPGSGYFLS